MKPVEIAGRLSLGALALGLAAAVWAMYGPGLLAPVAWTPPPGRHHPPTGDLAGLERIELPDGHAPEDVAVDSLGRVYAGIHDGRVLRWTDLSASPETLFDTGGRPLGLAFDAEGRLVIADATRGILRWPEGGPLQTLTETCGDAPLTFADDLEVGSDGTIWFSEASSRWRLPAWKMDFLESRASGRLCAWLPTTGKTLEVLGDLHFANGVAVDPEGRFVLVVESSRYRVRRLWLMGARAGEHDVLIDDLPGVPDGISTGTQGTFWIAIASPRNPLLDRLAGWPAVRRILGRLPPALQPAPIRSARIMGVNADGAVLADRVDPEGTGIWAVTNVREAGGWLYLGSLMDTAWARVPRP